MPVVWYAEPNYEDVLIGRGAHGGAAVRRRVLELQWLMGLQAGPGDWVVCEQPPETGELCELLQGVQYRTAAQASRDLRSMSGIQRAEWQLEPWAWSASALRFGQEAGLVMPRISADVVRGMNSRRSWPGGELLSCSGAGPQLQLPVTVCDSTAEVESAVAELTGMDVSRWLLKAEFGHSGRNQIRGSGGELKPQERGWLEKLWAISCCVVVEPVLQRTAECGLQWQLTECNGGFEQKFLGAIGLLSGRTGNYCGSLLGDWCGGNSWWMQAVEFQRQVVRELGMQGLRGLLGGDCMLTVWQGNAVVRPLQDLNARSTMGQLARSLQTFLKSGESAVWWHYSGNCDRERIRLIAREQTGVTVRETGPCAEDSGSGSCLLIAQESSQLAGIVTNLLGDGSGFEVGQLD